MTKRLLMAALVAVILGLAVKPTVVVVDPCGPDREGCYIWFCCTPSDSGGSGGGGGGAR